MAFSHPPVRRTLPDSNILMWPISVEVGLGRQVTPPRQHTERPAAVMLRGVRCGCGKKGLLAEAKGLDDGTVALDVLVLKVVEEGAALTYKCNEGTFGSMIFTVGLHVFRQMGNTV